MSKISILCFIWLFHASDLYAQLPDDAIMDLKRGRVANDTSYIYWLPFESGKKYFLVQGREASIRTLPTRFVTVKGARYLRPGQFYRSIHQ